MPAEQQAESVTGIPSVTFDSAVCPQAGSHLWQKDSPSLAVAVVSAALAELAVVVAVAAVVVESFAAVLVSAVVAAVAVLVQAAAVVAVVLLDLLA